MMDFFYLIPIAIALGVTGLCAFMWSLRSGQYEDLDGAAARILLEDEALPTETPASGGRAEAAPASDPIAGPRPPEVPPRPR
jgi:cbb3-type cytochrome oxidase maturation protein